MNFNTTASDFTTGRAFIDEVGYTPTRDTFSSALLRAAGTFGGGIALTAMLAVLVHH